MLVHLKDTGEFENLVKNGDVLVDFFATWCGPCKMLSPELEDLTDENSDITVIKVDVDQFPELAAKFNVRVVPTLFVFKDGENKKSVSGYMDKEALLRLVKQA